MKRFSMAIPASIVSDVPHLREKTSKIGLIGRAAAIFRVDEIIVYLDNPRVNQKADVNLIATLLLYMETPQYLRKRLFGLKPDLRYAGVLPPLRTPHHQLNRKMRKLKIGEHREGVVLSKTDVGVLVDIGVEQAAVIRNKRLPVGKRVTVKVKKGEVISESLAVVLSKLRIKPVEAGLAMKVAYDDGLIITEEHLRIDLNEVRRNLETAHADAFAISLSSAYPTRENTPMLIQVIHREAYTLAVNTAIPTSETIADLIRKAHTEMLSLSSGSSTVKEKTVPSEATEKS
ncbi:hypothetical protein ES702_03266 [subsurface metagenome]